MGLNTERIGHSYPPYHYEVSREKVREYAAATFVDDPLVRADAGAVPGHEVIAPPTFAACFTIGRPEIWEDPDLGAHWNLVHGSQAFTFHRPMRVGDVLRCTPTITDITVRSKMELLDLRIEAVDVATGEPVVTSDATIIFFTEAVEASR